MGSQAEMLGRGAWAAGAAAGTFLHDFGAGKSHEERLAQVRYLAHMLDDNFSIPGTRIRFGWDSILGFIPGLGDVAGTALALLIVRHAWQTGASKLTLTRMLGNVAADFAIGAIPLIGNLFDFAFKANRRNARLLERHFYSQSTRKL
jgi:hypothetical protein